MQVDAPLLQATLHDKGDESLGQFHHIVEFGVGNFRFDHPELSEMAPRLRFFRAKGGTERIHLAQRHSGRFHIKLARLREKRLLVEIVDGEERAGAFTRRRSNDGRIGQREAAFVEEVARRLDDLGPHSQNRRLPLGSHPEMPVLHQEVGAVFLGSNRVRRRLRHALHDLHIRHIELVAAMGPLVGANLAFDNDARLLRQGLDRIEHFRRDRVLRHNPLNDARAVAKLREQQLATFAQVVEPTADRDRLAFMLADFGNRSDR